MGAGLAPDDNLSPCAVQVDWTAWPGDCHFTHDVETWRLDVTTPAGSGLLVSSQTYAPFDAVKAKAH